MNFNTARGELIRSYKGVGVVVHRVVVVRGSRAAARPGSSAASSPSSPRQIMISALNREVAAKPTRVMRARVTSVLLRYGVASLSAPHQT